MYILTYILQSHLHVFTPKAVTKVTNMNGSSDVSGVDEWSAVAKIRWRLYTYHVCE